MIPVLVLPYILEHLDVALHALIVGVVAYATRVLLVAIRGKPPPDP